MKYKTLTSSTIIYVNFKHSQHSKYTVITLSEMYRYNIQGIYTHI